MDDSSFLVSETLRRFPFVPTDGQAEAVGKIASFLLSPAERRAFVLCGYAGTGKTSVVSALVAMLRSMRRKVVLMAPTGRAAKVFSVYSEHRASTIHKTIYRQKSILDQNVFTLDKNYHEDTLFIVDESSMISDGCQPGAVFGSGRLLSDLVSYVYSAKGCAMLLLGDDAQLPPVGENGSPALDRCVLGEYGLEVSGYTLTEVVRQAAGSGILSNATELRNAVSRTGKYDVPAGNAGFRIRLKGFGDIRAVHGSELIECISGCYRKDGIWETMVLCRSNKRAGIYNRGIRSTILDREEELSRGDRLMVVKNNYFWTERMISEYAGGGEDTSGIPGFIANGDMATVEKVRNVTELYGARFANVTLSFPDYDGFEFEARVLLDTLHTDAPALPKERQDELFKSVMEDYADVPDRRERMKLLRQNEYFNALQVKYAYAVTCHKAQGGQWTDIFIDQGGVRDDERPDDYYRWLYTALTRATGNVYLVNWPEKDLEA